MPKALGLIETRGLVAAIEAADAMVKAANVKIVGKEQTNPALITIKIVGDVAAVKSAVDAGAAAAQKVGEVVSIHVIPQPDSQMISLFPELADDEFPIFKENDVPNGILSEIPVEEIKSSKQEKTLKTDLEEIAVEVPVKEIDKPTEVLPKERPMSKPKTPPHSLGNLFTSQNDTISRLRQEALGKAESIKRKSAPSEDESTKIIPDINKEKKTLNMENLESLNVHLLRSLARETENFPIKGREISKANRQELLEYFRKNS